VPTRFWHVVLLSTTVVANIKFSLDPVPWTKMFCFFVRNKIEFQIKFRVEMELGLPSVAPQPEIKAVLPAQKLWEL
jgi:hypothetical protein